MCNTMAGLTSRDSKPLGQTQANLDEHQIQDVMNTVKMMQNPFTYNVEELVNISTGQVVADTAKDDILNAYRKGRMSF